MLALASFVTMTTTDKTDCFTPYACARGIYIVMLVHYLLGLLVTTLTSLL